MISENAHFASQIFLNMSLFNSEVTYFCNQKNKQMKLLMRPGVYVTVLIQLEEAVPANTICAGQLLAQTMPSSLPSLPHPLVFIYFREER